MMLLLSKPDKSDAGGEFCLSRPAHLTGYSTTLGEVEHVICGLESKLAKSDAINELPIGGKSIEGVVPCGLLDFLLCSVGDLNPPLGFYFPLFSMSFAREFPSGWKSVERSGIKIVVFL